MKYVALKHLLAALGDTNPKLTDIAKIAYQIVTEIPADSPYKQKAQNECDLAISSFLTYHFKQAELMPQNGLVLETTRKISNKVLTSVEFFDSDIASTMQQYNQTLGKNYCSLAVLLLKQDEQNISDDEFESRASDISKLLLTFGCEENTYIGLQQLMPRLTYIRIFKNVSSAMCYYGTDHDDIVIKHLNNAKTLLDNSNISLDNLIANYPKFEAFKPAYIDMCNKLLNPVA